MSAFQDAGAGNAMNGAEGAFESPHVKELSKNIRNIKKKLNATQKVDGIMAANAGVSLDDLLATKKINADQKAQAQKKPSLQASLAQLEEQLSQFKNLDEEYQRRLDAEKAELSTTHQRELETVKAEAATSAQSRSKQDLQDNLLLLSKFLRAAAAKRQDGDETAPDNRAFEGVLLLVYGGESNAVTAMESLINGSDERVPTIDATPSELTFKQVRDLAVDYIPYAPDDGEEAQTAGSTTAPAGTDPTIAYAGMTELDASTASMSLGGPGTDHNVNAPSASSVGGSAANAAGNGANSGLKAEMAAADEWVQVPRPPQETDTGLTATPAATTGMQSWADDVPQTNETWSSSIPNPDRGDGFREVPHHPHRGGRGRSDPRGGAESRGGRGRGGFRGDRRGGAGRGERSHGGDRGRGRGSRGRGRGSEA